MPDKFKLFLIFRANTSKGFKQLTCKNLCELFQLYQEQDNYENGDHPVAMREFSNGAREFAYLNNFPIIDWEYKYKERE